MRESFRRSIGSILYDKQVLAGQINALMMIAVDEHVRAEEGVEKVTGQIVGGVKDIPLWILVQLSVAHLSDRAAKIEVDELHALTDAEDGLILLIEQIQCVELLQSEFHVGRRNMADTAVIIFSAYAGKRAKRTAGCTGIAGRHTEKWQVIGERSEHITAAGQKQSVKNFRMLFYIGSIRKNDCAAARLFQSGLIVFMQSGGADERNLFHGEFLPEASYIMICMGKRKCEGYFNKTAKWRTDFGTSYGEEWSVPCNYGKFNMLVPCIWNCFRVY